jgi:glycosyltransferase involved in cell wall biosynthesis
MFSELERRLSNKNLSMAVFGSDPVNERKFAGDQDFASFYYKFPVLLLGFLKKKLRFHLFPRHIFKSDLLILEHSIGNIDYFFILILRRILGKKTGLWGHGYNITSSTNRFKKLLEKVMARFSHFYLAYTPKSANRISELGYKGKSIYVFNNSTDTKELSTNNFEVIQNPFQIHYLALIIGSTKQGKNLDSISRVLSKLRESFPNFQVIVVGGLNDLNRGLYSQDGLSFVGHAAPAELRLLSAKADFIISFGRIGLIATDSFALKLPIVGLSGAAHGPEIEYLDESNSILVDNHDMLNEKIVEMYHHPEILERLKNGCVLSSKLYSVEASAQYLLEALLLESNK